jgi:hypothetical protein
MKKSLVELAQAFERGEPVQLQPAPAVQEPAPVAEPPSHRKARERLATLGLQQAWDIFTSDTRGAPRETLILVDIVSRLVRWGSISGAQERFLHVLVEKIANAPALEAAREAERAAATPFPRVEGRTTVQGKVLSVKPADSPYGPVVKLLLQHADGWKAYGNAPAALREVKAGDEVAFEAALKASDRDDKFGFFSRPSKARLVRASAPVPAT